MATDRNDLYAIVTRDEQTGEEHVHTYKDTGKLLVGTWEDCQEELAIEEAMAKVLGTEQTSRIEPLAEVELRFAGRAERQLVAAG